MLTCAFYIVFIHKTLSYLIIYIFPLLLSYSIVFYRVSLVIGYQFLRLLALWEDRPELGQRDLLDILKKQRVSRPTEEDRRVSWPHSIRRMIRTMADERESECCYLDGGLLSSGSGFTAMAMQVGAAWFLLRDLDKAVRLVAVSGFQTFHITFRTRLASFCKMNCFTCVQNLNRAEYYRDSINVSIFLLFVEILFLCHFDYTYFSFLYLFFVSIFSLYLNYVI